MIISEEKWRPAATQTTVTICQSKASSVFFTKDDGHNMMIEFAGKLKQVPVIQNCSHWWWWLSLVIER